MKIVTGLLSLLCLAAAVGWYCPLIVRHRVKPAPATWIIACLAINLATISYLVMPDLTMSKKLVGGVALYGAAVEITTILVVVLIAYVKSGELKVAFDWVQKACLTVMGLTILYWVTHQNRPEVTFWTTQTLMVIAYFATIGKAIQRKSAFDSIGNWALILASCLSGIVPAWILQEEHGIVNSIRGAIMSAGTLGILLYFDRKNSFARWRDELYTLANFYRLNSWRTEL